MLTHGAKLRGDMHDDARSEYCRRLWPGRDNSNCFPIMIFSRNIDERKQRSEDSRDYKIWKKKRTTI